MFGLCRFGCDFVSMPWRKRKSGLCHFQVDTFLVASVNFISRSISDFSSGLIKSVRNNFTTSLPTAAWPSAATIKSFSWKTATLIRSHRSGCSRTTTLVNSLNSQDVHRHPFSKWFGSFHRNKEWRDCDKRKYFYLKSSFDEMNNLPNRRSVDDKMQVIKIFSLKTI